MTLSRLFLLAGLAMAFVAFAYQDQALSSPDRACARAAALEASANAQSATMVAITCTDTTYRVDKTGTAVKIGPSRWASALHVVQAEPTSRIYIVDELDRAHLVESWDVSESHDIIAFDSQAQGIERELAAPAAGEPVTAYGPAPGASRQLKVRAITSDPQRVWPGRYLQLDGLLVRGYSGGPILNSQGQLVALSYAIDPQEDQTYAVPAQGIAAMV